MENKIGVRVNDACTISLQALIARMDNGKKMGSGLMSTSVQEAGMPATCQLVPLWLQELFLAWQATSSTFSRSKAKAQITEEFDNFGDICTLNLPLSL
jgi:hypothetical protein